MLPSRLKIKTDPRASEENIVYWKKYRVTLLGARFFRLERSEKGIFRDEATQAVLYRNFPKRPAKVTKEEDFAVIETDACKLILREDRGQVCVEMNGKRILLDNAGNLLGTCRTLDGCNGEYYYPFVYDPTRSKTERKKIRLSVGVCSKTGVAVLDDSDGLTLGKNGQVRLERAEGTDEYIFAFGNRYREAVRTLFALCGYPPLLPRFALGNWWSRYHVYTEEEYLRLIATFSEREIPLSVATVDMDWHYTAEVDGEFGITAQGKKEAKYVGKPAVNLGWTGYTWNKKLFPEPRRFLQKLHKQGLKVALNLHPSDGVRFWEEGYAEMAKWVGRYASTQEVIPFDFTSPPFIDAYFEVLHRPREREGVDFWWIDWQQPPIPWQGDRERVYDPLWALNHYHYLDNARQTETPLVLSRYAGVGSHRYPVGFSGDTAATWETLAYLPYFTATASNVGYTWWSHDIGGHNLGAKEDELYVRHVQYGVFSPVNRLHCTCDDTATKEPWAYGNGAGEIAARFLRFRHKLVPYLYTAAYRTHTEGRALIEPLYYEWEEPKAYAYTGEYLFGELLIAPVTARREKDGFARIPAWLPEGEWTDIFTGEGYEIGRGGKEVTLYRDLQSIPALIRRGGILPLSADKGNGCKNPKQLEVWAYVGKGEYTLYEDGKKGALYTDFSSNYVEKEGVCTQSTEISMRGEGSVLPKNRTLFFRFKNIGEARVRLFVDGKEKEGEWLTDCAAARFTVEYGKRYRVEATFAKKSRLEKRKEWALKVLQTAEGENVIKQALYEELLAANTEKAFVERIKKSAVSQITKLRLGVL